MINCFPKFNELLKNHEIRLIGSNTNMIFQGYSFFIVNEELNLNQNQIIYDNFQEKPAIIINQFNEDDSKEKEQYFIISFKKTLLFIKQKQTILLSSLFLKNQNVQFYFLSDCQEVFIQNYKNQIKQNIYNNDKYFNEEISNFAGKIYTETSKNFIIKNMKYFNAIMRSIFGYLIKQSYSKLNTKSVNYDKPIEKIYDENDFIELKSIGLGSTFEAKLMYHIDKEGLFTILQTSNLNKKYLEKEIYNYRKINYPLIPKYYGTIKDKYCIIIDFINGQTLDKINEMNFNEKDRRIIFFQLLMIFNYLHKNEFVYRDLKPNNVIIDRMIKISDRNTT